MERHGSVCVCVWSEMRVCLERDETVCVERHGSVCGAAWECVWSGPDRTALDTSRCPPLVVGSGTSPVCWPASPGDG